VREKGDISRGAESTGGIWNGPPDGGGNKGLLGEVVVNEEGNGSVFLEKDMKIWEVIGRGLVVGPAQALRSEGDWEKAVVGIIARSAGTWDNEKVVCSCSGKTVWEEREEQVSRGML
jgi:copper chaperone for superoxide dismutase